MDEAAGLDHVLLPGGAREKTVISRVCLCVMGRNSHVNLS